MRGYFGIGAEGISKPVNMGSLLRSAHAFGASFVFTVGAHPAVRKAHTDTSKAPQHLPLYEWERVNDMALPRGCRLVGVELTEEAVDLPTFRHPLNAAYVLGPERGELSPAMLSRCDHLIRIPTKFCLNVQIAGAIVMYDRLRCLSGLGERPVRAGGHAATPTPHVHGQPRRRKPEGPA